MVPHLNTALEGPINELEQRFLDGTPVIERWFRLEWMEHAPTLYCAVDIRNAGFKLAPVDTDLFPANWHNLSPEVLPLIVQAAQAGIEKVYPQAHRLLIIPESRELPGFYLENLAWLQDVFRMAGLDVRLGSIDPSLKQSKTLTAPSGAKILLEPLQRQRHRLGLKHFDPDVILLNTDLAQGTPGILEDLRGQHMLPPLQAGWSVRRKSVHFNCYEDVCKRFGKVLGIDPWLINPLFSTCDDIDLHTPEGMDRVRSSVSSLLSKIRRKYKQYGIHEKPFVVVKTDWGSRGMGIMTVHDAKELPLPEKAAENNLLNHIPSGDIIVQEGILTNERVQMATAEPVVYMMDRYVVGGFYRIHAERDTDENLKAPGARYVPLPFSGDAHLPRLGASDHTSSPNRFYMYGVVARLAMVAASYELEATDPNLQES